MGQRFKVISQNGVTGILNQNGLLIFILFSFLLGMLIGVLGFKQNSATDGYYSEQFKSFIGGLSGSSWHIIGASILELLPFIAGLFLSGTCMVGWVLTPVLMAIRGFMMGSIISYIYFNNSLIGVVFNLLIIMPTAVVSTLALVLSARESFGFSLSLARLALPGVKNHMLDKDFKLYCIRQLFMLLFFAAAVLIRLLMATSFYSFLNLK